jgi:NADPH:quinone reductase and related Zn-dependent oxidoreductases
LPVALITLHNALITAGRLRPGESVMIQGASSGVGLMGLQIAKLMGAKLVIRHLHQRRAPGAAEGIRCPILPSTRAIRAGPMRC